MILPIVAYGDPVLRKTGEEIDKNYPNLKELIANMFETMYEAAGVGLAAPQVGKAIQLFIVDASPFAEDEEDNSATRYKKLKDFKRVFINPQIMEETGLEWAFNEGCLSIPTIREDVYRKPKIRVHYYDEQFNFHDEEFDDIAARIVQHEYDHIKGKLFVDYLTPMRKRLLKNKLVNITSGNVDVNYKMKFPRPK